MPPNSTQLVAEIYGVVGTVIVDQDADVDQARQFIDGDLQSLLRVVSGHDDRDALPVDHFFEKKKRTKVSLPEFAAEQARRVTIAVITA